MTEVVVSAREFLYGRNQYRLTASGVWTVQMWGWWPEGKNPRTQWVLINAEDVPDEVKKAAGVTP